MSSGRDTYTATVKTAAVTATTATTAAQTAFQETINQSGCNVGYTTQAGSYANFLAAVKAATAAKLAAVNAAEQAKQATIAVARDTLRTAGDVAPV
jgi:hypothetical protein